MNRTDAASWAERFVSSWRQKVEAAQREIYVEFFGELSEETAKTILASALRRHPTYLPTIGELYVLVGEATGSASHALVESHAKALARLREIPLDRARDLVRSGVAAAQREDRRLSRTSPTDAARARQQDLEHPAEGPVTSELQREWDREWPGLREQLAAGARPTNRVPADPAPERDLTAAEEREVAERRAVAAALAEEGSS